MEKFSALEVEKWQLGLSIVTTSFNMHKLQLEQARKLQATLEGCNPKLSITYSLTDGGKV